MFYTHSMSFFESVAAGNISIFNMRLPFSKYQLLEYHLFSIVLSYHTGIFSTVFLTAL